MSTQATSYVALSKCSREQRDVPGKQAYELRGGWREADVEVDEVRVRVDAVDSAGAREAIKEAAGGST